MIDGKTAIFPVVGGNRDDQQDRYVTREDDCAELTQLVHDCQMAGTRSLDAVSIALTPTAPLRRSLRNIIYITPGITLNMDATCGHNNTN